MNGEFSLSGREIADDLKGLYFSKRRDSHPNAKILKAADERTLSDAVIHSIVIRPNPKDDDDDLGREYNKAIIQIFKRLNTSGKALTPQEVRASIFHGELLTLIQNLNDNPDWRALFGAKHSRMKDEETILRAIALYQNGDKYKASMPKFLDSFMENNRHIKASKSSMLEIKFQTAVKLVREHLGDTALKNSGTFVLTRFDALTVGLMNLIPNKVFETIDECVSATEELLAQKSIKDRLAELEGDRRGLNDHDEEIEKLTEEERGYLWSTAKFTNDTNRVSVRLRVAKEVFTEA